MKRRSLKGKVFMQLAKSIDWVLETPLAELHQVKRQMLESGRSIIDLSMINPDLAPPRYLVDRLVESSLKPTNHRYAVSRGVRKLREAIASKYTKHFSVTLDPELEVCATMGSKDALAQALECLLNDGDSIVVGAPTYPGHLSALKRVHAMVDTFALSTDETELLSNLNDLLQRVQPRLLLLNFPNNPLGIQLSQEGWSEIHRLCKDKDIFLINDFTYGELGYGDEKPISALESDDSREHTAELVTLSKSHSIAGWRVGALVGNQKLVRAAQHMKSHVDYGIFLPIQFAAAAGLTTDEELVSGTKETYERRWKALSSGLERVEFKVAPASAGCCVWAKLPESVSGLSSAEFAKRLLAEQGVVCTPGILFGKDSDQHIRFALVRPEEELTEVVGRLEAFLN